VIDPVARLVSDGLGDILGSLTSATIAPSHYHHPRIAGTLQKDSSFELASLFDLPLSLASCVLNLFWQSANVVDTRLPLASEVESFTTHLLLRVAPRSPDNGVL
jgi:hypothetical protein